MSTTTPRRYNGTPVVPTDVAAGIYDLYLSALRDSDVADDTESGSYYGGQVDAYLDVLDRLHPVVSAMDWADTPAPHGWVYPGVPQTQSSTNTDTKENAPMIRFTLDTLDGTNPSVVDMERDSDVDTAQVWSLHVRVPDNTTTDAFLNRVQTQTEGAITIFPEMCGGDSFAEWGEPFTDTDDSRALHLYVAAPDRVAATGVGVTFMALVGMTPAGVALSTGADWAEQVTLPRVNTWA